MKQSFFYLVAFVLTIGFAHADVSEYKDKKASKSTGCPFLNSIVNSGNTTDCPYISIKSKAENKCPYTEEKKSGKCPYSDEMKEGSLKIEKKKSPEVEIKSS